MGPKAGLIFPFPGEIDTVKSLSERESGGERERHPEVALFSWLFFVAPNISLDLTAEQ